MDPNTKIFSLIGKNVCDTLSTYKEIHGEKTNQKKRKENIMDTFLKSDISLRRAPEDWQSGSSGGVLA
jgi:hypothetical protein